MSTSIQGPLVRSVGPRSFLHITAVPVAEIAGGGVLFDGDLTDNEVGDVWWFVTSRDDDDMTRRQSLAALRDTADPGLCAALVAYVLGEAL